MKKSLTIALLTSTFILALLNSCDTPRSIAWSYYFCARDTMDAGDPYAAKRYLDKCNTAADKDLALKADSLMRVAEKAIEEDKAQKKDK
ncbi:MAG: hypothetical protein K6C30_00035 [Bacteroidaceae bacterium]|nr:hypothetical protein [Bacteroidaceae bacterium]